MRVKKSAKSLVLNRLMPATRFARQFGPLHGVHNEWTILTEDQGDAPSEEILDLATELIARIRNISMDRIGGRSLDPSVDRWPGEHYRLLTAACDIVQPKLAVDVGTATGLSVLAMLRSPGVGRVVTFDIEPWSVSKWGGSTALREEDFGPRLSQEVADLGASGVFDSFASTMSSAELIFVDGPKDGVFEPAFFAQLYFSPPKVLQLLIVDDIRVMPMVRLWHGLPAPRLDFTSFGHFSGTGLLLRHPSVANDNG